MSNSRINSKGERKKFKSKGPIKIVSAGGILKTERGLTKAAKDLVKRGRKASKAKAAAKKKGK